MLFINYFIVPSDLWFTRLKVAVTDQEDNLEGGGGDYLNGDVVSFCQSPYFDFATILTLIFLPCDFFIFTQNLFFFSILKICQSRIY